MMRATVARSIIATAVIAASVTAGCGADDGGDDGDGGGDGGDGAELLFGEHGGPCPPTVLANEADDAELLRSGSACFASEVEAGRPVTWDVLMPTVEGDPILRRYSYDGTTVTVTTDSTRDEFGNGEVTVSQCTGIEPTEFLPEGTGCVGASGPGFRSDGLP